MLLCICKGPILRPPKLSLEIELTVDPITSSAVCGCVTLTVKQKKLPLWKADVRTNIGATGGWKFQWGRSG